MINEIFRNIQSGRPAAPEVQAFRLSFTKKSEEENTMKNIEKWLQENGIEYRKEKYGKPYYFNDGFQVEGLRIAFYFDEIGNTRKQENQLIEFMSRKKAYICKPFRFGYGYSYNIMTVFDAARLEKHEKAVADAVEAFWQAEHARRMQAEKAM